MLDIIVETLIDSIKLLPFLFIAFLIIEYIENKMNKKATKAVSKSQKLGPLVGSLLGAVPQCGFSVVATNLYVTRIITLGTLISIYLSTSDEMLPILISNKADISIILSLLGLKVIIGMLSGFIIDLVIHKKEEAEFSLCEEEHCDCQDSIFKSALKHTLKIFCFILIISLVINVLLEYFHDYLFSSVIKKNKIISPFISSLIGLIPSCASSVALTEFYLNDIISFGTVLAGLLTNSGLSLLILFRTNKNIKENIGILLLVYFLGSISGLIINLIY